MITNPQVGMRVCIHDYSRTMDGTTGIITYVYRAETAVLMNLDVPMHGMRSWFSSIKHLSHISPEDQAHHADQQRRQEHAMKHL